MARFFYKIDEKEYGPATESQLAEVGIGPGTLVRYEHGRYYKPAREINDLAYLFENMSDEELASGPVPLEPEVHTGYAEDLAREAVEQGRRVELETDRVPGQSAGWLLPAGLVFALAGGVIGGGIGAYIRWRIARVERGRVLWKYKQSHRTWGSFIIGLSIVSVIFWNIYYLSKAFDDFGDSFYSAQSLYEENDPYEEAYTYPFISDEPEAEVSDEPYASEETYSEEDALLDEIDETVSAINETGIADDEDFFYGKTTFNRTTRKLAFTCEVRDEEFFNQLEQNHAENKKEMVNNLSKKDKEFIDKLNKLGCKLVYTYNYQGRSTTYTIAAAELAKASHR